MGPFTPLGQVLTKGCDEFTMIHSPPPPSRPQGVHKWWWWPSICSLTYIFLGPTASVILSYCLVTQLANCDTKLVFQLLPLQHHDFSLLGFKIQGQCFFKKAMSIGVSVASAASGSSSKCNIVSEMGSGISLIAYCPEHFDGKRQQYTTIWQAVVAGRQGVPMDMWEGRGFLCRSCHEKVNMAETHKRATSAPGGADGNQNE